MNELLKSLLVLAPVLIVVLVLSAYAVDNAWQSFTLRRRRSAALKSFYDREG